MPVSKGLLHLSIIITTEQESTTNCPSGATHLLSCPHSITTVFLPPDDQGQVPQHGDDSSFIAGPWLQEAQSPGSRHSL